MPYRQDAFADTHQTKFGSFDHLETNKIVGPLLKSLRNSVRGAQNNIVSFAGQSATQKNIREALATGDVYNMSPLLAAQNIAEIYDAEYQNFGTMQHHTALADPTDPDKLIYADLQKELDALQAKINSSQRALRVDTVEMYQKHGYGGRVNDVSGAIEAFQSGIDRSLLAENGTHIINGLTVSASVVALFFTGAIVPVGIGSVLANFAGHVKRSNAREKIITAESNVRKVDSNSLLVGMQYQQNLKNQLLDRPLDYQDIDEITRMKSRLEEDKSFYNNLKKSNEKSSYLGDLLLQVVEQNLERFNHRLLEMVKVIELEVTGRREQESEHGVYETQIVSNPTDLLIYSQKVKEIQSLYTGSNKQTFANLTAVLNPVATMTREERRDNFGTLASEVDAIVTKHETDLAVFENKIAGGDVLSTDDIKEMERLVALARCGVNAFQTGLNIPGAYLKRQHLFDRGKVDRSVIDRLAAMQDSVSKLDIKLNLLVIPKAEADIALIDTNLAKIDAQINNVPMSRITYEALKKQLTIVDKCMEAGRAGIVDDTRRDSENISRSLLTANIATTPESIYAWNALDADEKNILQGLDGGGNPIDFYRDYEDNKAILVNVAIKYLEVLNPYLMSSGGDVQGYLETSFVTAWLIHNYLGPKVKKMQTTLETNKPPISEDFDPQINGFEAEVTANEAKDYSNLGEIVTSTNVITTYISANPILTNDQKTRLERFKTRLETLIKDLIDNQYAEIQTATDDLIGRLKTGGSLNYKITDPEFTAISTELDVLQIRLTDLNDNLNTLYLTTGYEEKQAEVQTFIELVQSDIDNINLLKAKKDPEISIQELKQHYLAIKSILDDDKSVTPPTADLSEGNLKNLKTFNDQMQVVFDEFTPVTINLLPNGLQKDLNAAKLAMETSQSIYRYYDESEVALSNFFDQTLLVDFTDYTTFKGNIEILTNSLKTVEDQKTALKSLRFKITFDLHLDAISKEYQATLTWVKGTMNTKIDDTACNFTADQISALHNLFGTVTPILDNPFADEGEIIE